MRLPLIPTTIASCAVIAATALATAPSAGAASADASVTGGTLSFINGTPGNVTFPSVALDGTNKTTAQSQTFNVNDARGTGAGWNITATSTRFTAGGGVYLDGPARILSAPAATCDAGATCTPATPTGVTYPYTLPADAPATRMFASSANTGLGAQTLSPNWTLTVPADTRAGSYTSTWTFSLVSGP